MSMVQKSRRCKAQAKLTGIESTNKPTYRAVRKFPSNFILPKRDESFPNPLSTITGSSTTNSSSSILPAHITPNVTDFLTFLCYHRTSILPPSLDYLKQSSSSSLPSSSTMAAGEQMARVHHDDVQPNTNNSTSNCTKNLNNNNSNKLRNKNNNNRSSGRSRGRPSSSKNSCSKIHKKPASTIPSPAKTPFDVKVVLRRIFLGDIEQLQEIAQVKMKTGSVQRRPLKEVTKQSTSERKPKKLSTKLPASPPDVVDHILPPTPSPTPSPSPPPLPFKFESYRTRTRYGFFRIPPPLEKVSTAKRALTATTKPKVIRKLPQKPNKKSDAVTKKRTKLALSGRKKNNTAKIQHSTSKSKRSNKTVVAAPPPPQNRKLKELTRGRGRPKINRDDNKSPKQTLIAKKPSAIKRIRT